MPPVKVLTSAFYSIVIKFQVQEKNQRKTIALTICKTEFKENNCLKIARPDGHYQNMVNDFREAIAAFIAMPKTMRIAQPNKLNATNINKKGAAPHCKIGLPLNSLFL